MSSRRNVAGLLRPLLQARLSAPRSTFAPFRSIVPRATLLQIQSRLIHQTRSLRSAENTRKPAEDAAHGDVTTFKELGTRGLVAQNVLRPIIDSMQLETMTPVQVQTINPCLKGVDVIAQAKTGTGKTLGFLIPVIQRILEAQPALEKPTRYRERRGKGMDIRAIIISPTRELAEQIAVEAKKLVSHTSLKVQTAVGGTQKSKHLREMQREGCHLLVGTPGRLHDIFSDPSTGVRAPDLDALVLDEADRLLDDGFGPDIQRIHDECLPRKDVKDRQTLMFSATMPREVMRTVKKLMHREFEFVQTISEDEVPTHDKIPQHKIDCVGMENLLPTVVELIQREMNISKENGKPFKAIVFHNSNAEVILFSEIFQKLTGRNSYNRRSVDKNSLLAGLNTTLMSSRLSQAQRTRNSESFRRMSSGILFSTDVSARGMDFPNVTHVIQLGVPQKRDNYIHRIGRTGRGDKSGQAWLLTCPVDAKEANNQLSGFPMQVDTSFQTAQVDMTKDGQIPANTAAILTASLEAAQGTDEQARKDAYKAFLGAYNYARKSTLSRNLLNLSKYCWGMQTPPAISPALAKKLGFTGTPGMNFADEPRPRPRESNRHDHFGGADKYDRQARSGGSDRGFGRSSSGGYSRDDRSGRSARSFTRSSSDVYNSDRRGGSGGFGRNFDRRDRSSRSYGGASRDRYPPSEGDSGHRRPQRFDREHQGVVA